MEKKDADKREKNFIKKPFSIGFVFSIIFTLFFFITFILSIFNLFPVLGSTLLILNLFFYIIICASFFYLGKKHNSNLITKTIIVFVIFFIIGFFILVGIFFNTFSNLKSNEEIVNITKSLKEKGNSLSDEDLLKISNYFKSFFLFSIIFYFIYAILQTIISVGIFKIKDSNYSKPFAIFNIIISWLPLTIIGIYLLFPLYVVLLIFQILLFYEQGKKFQEF
ncbi:MAG: hypothetical protein QW103_02405 [Candidatus Pacearchaeota archaeon]